MQTPEDNAASPALKPPTAAGAADPSPPSGKPVAGAKASPDDTGTGAASSAAANQEKPAQPRKTGKSPDIASDPGADAIELLKADHRRVEALVAEYESASDRRKAAIIREACTELTLHTLLEEEIFYPACRAADGEETEDALDEAQVEHDCAKLLIIELLASSQDDPLQSARFKVLAEQIKHHVAEEEAPRTGVFAKATAAGVDTAALGRRLQERKRRLLKKADRLRPSHLVSFHQLQGENRPTQEYGMPRNQGPERDERGRFVSDDDDDRRGGSYSRSRDDDRRDDSDRGGHGRGGWFGDSEGHSMAARSRGEGRSFRDDEYDGDGRGWYGDSRGHAQAARRGGDERRSTHGDDDRDRDDRGRFMSDDDRSGRGGRSSSSDRDRDDQGRFMSDDDRSGRGGGGRGRSSSSDRDRDDQGRFMSDDDRSGRSSGGRGRSSSSDRDRDDQGRFMSDDDRTGRGGGGRGRSSSFDRDRDDQGRFMSDDDRSSRGGGRSSSSDRERDSRSYRGRDDDDGDGRGWYGDSRGHAEAARRGWESRSHSSRDDDDRSRGSDRGHGGWFGDSRGHSDASRRGWENRR
ncbi:hemerythrin domain-containing protein [Brevundimonas sp.]|uniref:hemerythrin domain-containing protein n=2 Tax=Brevundimonas sp. TaxID=1871086 RepID=UPI0028981255|nr:hemerythrin domain-containing protein [Brevundimonas sp.]